jgi:hypothetical protein
MKIGKCGNAVLGSMSALYVFNVIYPKEVCPTLLFLQLNFLGRADASTKSSAPVGTLTNCLDSFLSVNDDD